MNSLYALYFMYKLRPYIPCIGLHVVVISWLICVHVYRYTIYVYGARSVYTLQTVLSVTDSLPLFGVF